MLLTTYCSLKVLLVVAQHRSRSIYVVTLGAEEKQSLAGLPFLVSHEEHSNLMLICDFTLWDLLWHALSAFAMSQKWQQ